MSHSITQPNSGDFCYSDFRLLDKHSDSNDICRIMKNKSGDVCLSSAYSLKERFIQFLSYIPLVSRLDFVSKQIDLIKAEQADAVTVFLRVLRDEFGINHFCTNADHHENRPDYLKCKNISVWFNAAANSTDGKEKITITSHEVLKILSERLTLKFGRLSSETIDRFINNTPPCKYMDVMLNKVNIILQKAQVPEHLHVNLRESILEHINLNALDGEYSLKSISDSIYDFMKVSHMGSGEEFSTGKPFTMSDNVLRVMEKVNTENNFTCAGMVFAGVAELKAEIKSSGQVKNEIRSSLQAYTMNHAYMHALVAPAISMQPEDKDISSDSSVPRQPSMPAASSIPPPPSMPAASSVPPPPSMPLTLLFSSALTSQSPLSYPASQSEKSKGAIEKKAETDAVQAGDIIGVMNDETFLKKLQQRRNALEGRPNNENQREDSTIDKVKAASHHRDETGILGIMKRGFDNIYASRVSFGSDASTDSGLNTNSNRTSVAGDSGWNE